MSATVMYLIFQENTYPLTGPQSVTARCHGADALVTDPVASTARGMRCHLQTYSGAPESNHCVIVGMKTRLVSSLPSKGWVVPLIDRPHRKPALGHAKVAVKHHLQLPRHLVTEMPKPLRFRPIQPI